MKIGIDVDYVSAEDLEKLVKTVLVDNDTKFILSDSGDNLLTITNPTIQHLADILLTLPYMAATFNYLEITHAGQPINIDIFIGEHMMAEYL